MKVSTLLKKALKCKTGQDAAELLRLLQAQFEKSPKLKVIPTLPDILVAFFLRLFSACNGYTCVY